MNIIFELPDFIECPLKFNHHISYLVGIKGLSLISSLDLDVKAFNELSSNNPEAFFSLNCERLFTDLELKDAKKTLEELNLTQVENIFYSDFGFYMILKELKLESKAIYRAPTYLTNYQDVNLHLELNKSVVVSNKISSSELKEVCKKANKNIFVDAFLMDQIFYSRRKLITNYFKYKDISLDPQKDTYLIKEEIRNDLMHILEDNTGTHIFESGFSTLSNELITLENVDSIIIHTKYLPLSISVKILSLYDKLLTDKDVKSFYEGLKETEIRFYKGLYDRKTILVKEKDNA